MPTVFRDDLSDRLVHLTKGENNRPFETLVSILNDRALRGGTGFIKGKHTCVCFSEAPLSKLPQILSTPHDDVKYKPYGVMFEKSWIFARGGRPVIYQPDSDYALLPDSKKHLHVRFELGREYAVDHTWEREWRVSVDRLEFGPDDATVIVPTRIISDALKEAYTDNPTDTATDVVGLRSTYPWHVVALEDLGVPISDGLVFGGPP